MKIPARGLTGQSSELSMERICRRPYHRCPGEHRESNAIGVETHLRDLLAGARLLLPEIVGWESQNREPSCGKPAMKPLEPLVLRRISTLAGGVDHQQHLAAELAERKRGVILQARKHMVQKRGTRGRTC